MNKVGPMERVVKKLTQFHKEVQKKFDEDGIPVVYQIGDTTVVGEETVRKQDGVYLTGYFPTNRKRYSPEAHEFNTYDSAVSFCIARQRGMNSLCRDILMIDRLVWKYKFDQKNFIRLMQSAIKNRNIFQAELYQLRLEEAMRLYRSNQQQLEQLCLRAKYKHNKPG